MCGEGKYFEYCIKGKLLFKLVSFLAMLHEMISDISNKHWVKAGTPSKDRVGYGTPVHAQYIILAPHLWYC